MRSRTRSRAARLVVPAAVVALLLAGCGGATPGTAAVVESERLTVEEVQEQTAAFLEAYPEAATSGVTTEQVTAIQVENFVRKNVVDEAARRAGISVSEADIDNFITERGGIEEVTRLTSGQGVPPFPDLVRAEVRSFLLQRALGEAGAGPGASDDDISIATRAATDAMSAALDIEVNPRYGVWDGSTVTPGGGSLSLTVDELNAPPGGLQDPAAIPPG